MNIIFCDSVIDPRQVGPDHAEEYEAALKNGFTCYLISHEAVVEGNILSALKYVQKSGNEQLAIYRGWMLTASQYTSFYEGLLNKNIRLINSPDDYRHCHYFPDAYHLIKKMTPKSAWTDKIDDKAITELVKDFGDSSLILKDYVKSEKHHWQDACFIPDASDAENVKTIVKNFLRLRGEYLNEGLVFRRFADLEYLSDHSKSKMPLALEYRLFFRHHEILHICNYWEEGDYPDELPNTKPFLAIARKINSNFFTMDIAKKKNGEWIIMELGDGQVAGLPENADIDSFYRNLRNAL